MEQLATKLGALAEAPAVVLEVETHFNRAPQRVDTAYYGGAYYWVVWWKYEEEYSVVDARGGMLPAEDVEHLRPALEASLAGVPLATEARAEAEARHDSRMRVIGRLFAASKSRL